MVFRSRVVTMAAALCASWVLPVMAQNGACCVDGSCQADVPQDVCSDMCGTWLGVNSACNLCPFVEVGVCCLGNTCDAGLGPDSCECSGGSWVGGATGCTGTTCGGALGRCCAPGECIDDTTVAECDALCGMWSQVQTCGGAFPCLKAFGACCVGESCTTASGPASCTCLGGTWHSNTTCSLAGSNDCNGNGIVDLCEGGPDCNANGVPDECDIADGTSEDCNGNAIPDECELDADCTQNEDVDCNFDGVLDACEPDCQLNGTSDVCELVNELVVDCGGGGPDVGNPFFGQILHNANCAECHGVGGDSGTAPNHRNMSRYRYQWKTSGCVSHIGGMFEFTLSQYADLEAYLSDLGGGGNGVPDECEGLADCDSDGIADECELAACPEAEPGEPGYDPSCLDCNGNGVPDGCDISQGTAPDCNGNGVPDACDIANGQNADCNNNGIPDSCDIAGGKSDDCNGDGVPNECDPDCNGTGTSDVCDVVNGAEDCDGNLVPDECEPDCNGNGVNDVCDIADGTSSDLNGNGIPDDCDPDCNGNGVPDDLDLFPQSVGLTMGEDFGATGLAIPDCGGAGSDLVRPLSVDFGSSCGTVESIHVELEIEHSWVGDLVVELESPAGTVVTLLSRIGFMETGAYCDDEECCGSSATFLSVNLGDAWPASIETASVPEGDFSPDAGATGNPGMLSAFSGEGACGTWMLRLHDAAVFDVGALHSWSLDFRALQVSSDCDGNGVPDECDIAGGAGDCNANGIPDVCEDCNGNGVADSCDLADGTSDDCNEDGLPDECGLYRDCNGNGVLDSCDLADGVDVDCDGNQVLDGCDLAGFGGMFVSSFSSNRVNEYDIQTGAYLGSFVDATPSPAGIVFGPTGDLLVGNYVEERISMYDGATGVLLGDFVPSGVVTPIDLEYGPDGNLYSLSLGLGTVESFDGLTGAPLGTFATLPISKQAQLALAMRFGPDGNLFVAVFNPPRVIEFDGVTGALVGDFGETPNLQSAVGLAFNADGDLFVADSVAGTIEIFDGTSGVALGTLTGGFPPGNLAFSPMEFGPDGDLYLTHSSLNVAASLDGETGEVVHVFPTTVLSLPIAFTLRPPATDCDANGVPDRCEDCNDNGLADVCDISSGLSEDVDGNGVPDECDGEDVTLEIVIRTESGGDDVALELPSSVAFVEKGQSFFAELWATDGGAVNSGLVQVHADVQFDPDSVEVTAIDHRPPFTIETSGVIDNDAGRIDGLGGVGPDGGGGGIAPEWRRIAVVTMSASDCVSEMDIALSAAALPVEVVDRGIVSPSTIAFGLSSLAVEFPCIYNLDGSDPINAGDLGLFAGCWLTGLGEPGYLRACDFDCSGFVDAGDLGWFATGWLDSCAMLNEFDLPVCRRCETGGAASTVPPALAIGIRAVSGGSMFVPGTDRVTFDVLVRDDASSSRGVTALYLDLVMVGEGASGRGSGQLWRPRINVSHASEFALFPADGEAVGHGRYRFGGATVNSGAGAGDWVPVARVSIEGLAGSGLSLSDLMSMIEPSPGGVSAVGWGHVTAEMISVVRIDGASGRVGDGR